MIIGNGAIAKALEGHDRTDRMYFAAGVANSQETDEKEYAREVNRLSTVNRKAHLVYFSSLCVFDTWTRYADHKRMMEEYVKKWFTRHTIVRMGNIEWATNPHQLIPFLKRWDVRTPLLNEYRYLLTLDEFLYWINLIPSWTCEMNIVGERLKVIDIAKRVKGEL